MKLLSLADWGSSRLRRNIVHPSPQSASGPLFKNNERIKHAVFNNVYHTLLIRNTSTKMRPKLHLHHSRTRKPRKPIKLGKMRTVYPLPPGTVLCWRLVILRPSTVYKGKKKAKVTKQIIYLGWLKKKKKKKKKRKIYSRSEQSARLTLEKRELNIARAMISKSFRSFYLNVIN